MRAFVKKVFGKSEREKGTLPENMAYQNGRYSAHANKIYNNILETIGDTPIVRLNKIPKDHGLECEILVKCEFMNPGGSIKDRIAHTMLLDAEKRGLARANTRLVEPTSGNTGIGVSLAAAVGGYACTIVTPDKNSNEKMDTMRLLGAEVIQTPAMAPYGSPENFVSVARKILETDPNAISLDQYDNEVNPQTHYDYTAEEILSAVGELDAIVIGAGTGGTLTGIARKIKERRPKCTIVAVDPSGSTMFDGGVAHLFYVEGIGGDFVPKVLDKNVADKVIHPDDKHSFTMCRELISKEGILCGGSSGAAVYSAIVAAKELGLGAGQRVVVILADGIRNYMTKFVSDQWMEAHLFKDPPQRDHIWWNRSVSNLEVPKRFPSVPEDASCREALSVMGSDHDITVVICKDGFLKGVISRDSIRSETTNPKRKGEIFHLSDPVSKHLMKNMYKIAENHGMATIGLASRILDIAPFVVLVERHEQPDAIKYIPKGIITPNIVLDYIFTHQNRI